MVKPYDIIPKTAQFRLLHETWDLTYTQPVPDTASYVADIGAWLIKSMREDSPVRVLTIMACLGYAVGSDGHVTEREIS